MVNNANAIHVKTGWIITYFTTYYWFSEVHYTIEFRGALNTIYYLVTMVKDFFQTSLVAIFFVGGIIKIRW